MLDTLPRELIELTLSYFEFYDLTIYILISKRYKNIIENIIKTTNIVKLDVQCKKDIHILHIFKPCVKKLYFWNTILHMNFFENLNLSGINYETLHFNFIDLWDIADLIKLDPKIPQKCKKICFDYCIYYSWPLMTSLQTLEKCKSIKFKGDVNLINDSDEFCYFIKKILDTLPEITITFDFWALNDNCLALLSEHERIIVKD